MMKAVFGRDIRKGDAVLMARNELTMMTDGVPPSSIGPHRIYSLLHRPWPKGKTKEDMLEAIDSAMRILEFGRRDPEVSLTVLREALEAYELGKPLKENDDWVHPRAEYPSSPSGCGLP